MENALRLIALFSAVTAYVFAVRGLMESAQRQWVIEARQRRIEHLSRMIAENMAKVEANERRYAALTQSAMPFTDGMRYVAAAGPRSSWLGFDA